MRWDKVSTDSYYRARQYEYMAKRFEKYNDHGKAMECWQRYAEIKMKKGSYFLAYFGMRQVSRLARKLGNEKVLAKANKEAESLERENYPHYHDHYYNAISLEIRGKVRDSIEAYESLGNYFNEIGNYFLAADSFEHAAESRHKAGLPVKDYGLPHEAWSMNSRYWMEQGEQDDSKWSKERREYYEKLYRE